MFNGIEMSDTLLDFFGNLLESNVQASDIYVPFTNANDFSIETCLIPNTHIYFPAITSRAYYDTRYARYRKKLNDFGIRAISTFALVDPEKDKNHIGEFLVKV